MNVVLLSKDLARFVTREITVSFPIPESTSVTFSKDFSDIVFVEPGEEEPLMQFGVFSFDVNGLTIRDYGCAIHTRTQAGPHRSYTVRLDANINEEIRMDLLQRNGLKSGTNVAWSGLIGNDEIVAPIAAGTGLFGGSRTAATRRTTKRSRVFPQSF